MSATEPDGTGFDEAWQRSVRIIRTDGPTTQSSPGGRFNHTAMKRESSARCTRGIGESVERSGGTVEFAVQPSNDITTDCRSGGIGSRDSVSVCAEVMPHREIEFTSISDSPPLLPDLRDSSR